MQITKIIATYQANYNGCSLETGDHQGLDELSPELELLGEKCSEAICDELYDNCDEDGYYQGADITAKVVMTKQVKKAFGEHVEVECRIDSFSS